MRLVDHLNEFEDEVRAQKLFKLWQYQFSHHLAEGSVVEATFKDKMGVHTDFVACAVGFWVEPDFWEFANRLGTKPGVSLIAEVIDQDVDPFIIKDRKKIAKGVANRNLNLFVAHFAVAQLPAELEGEIYGLMSDNLSEKYSGYGLNRLYKEVFSERERDGHVLGLEFRTTNRETGSSWVCVREKKNKPYIEGKDIDLLFNVPESPKISVPLSQSTKDYLYCLHSKIRLGDIAMIFDKERKSVQVQLKRARDRVAEQGTDREQACVQKATSKDADHGIALLSLYGKQIRNLRPSPCLNAHLWRDASYETRSINASHAVVTETHLHTTERIGP